MSADSSPSEDEDWLSLLDLSAVADPGDKVRECEYFLALAEAERDRERFRWLISAFFGGAYSFFETSALYAYAALTAPDTGEPLADFDAVAILEKYVGIRQSDKDPYFVKTSGRHEITKRLYDLRKSSTHHVPLSIMVTGPSLPADFQFGSSVGAGTPALEFCRSLMQLIRQVQHELNA
jgi:hypothetical protein